MNYEDNDLNCKAKIYRIRWSTEEDKRLLQTVQRNKPTWKEWEDISKLFHRSRLGCYVRWKRLQQQQVLLYK